MPQAPLHYNEQNPEGAWRLLRDDIAAADADFVATQARPADDLLLGTPGPGPQSFEGVRYYLQFYLSTDPDKAPVAGGTWDAQPIEVAPIPPPAVAQSDFHVIGGEILTGIAGMAVVTLGGWREAVFSLRVAAIVFPGGADRARIFVREF
jgi:hypothetical protein